MRLSRGQSGQDCGWRGILAQHQVGEILSLSESGAPRVPLRFPSMRIRANALSTCGPICDAAPSCDGFIWTAAMSLALLVATLVNMVRE